MAAEKVMVYEPEADPFAVVPLTASVKGDVPTP
jgi:hypothetical protein